VGGPGTSIRPDRDDRAQPKGVRYPATTAYRNPPGRQERFRNRDPAASAGGILPSQLSDLESHSGPSC